MSFLLHPQFPWLGRQGIHLNFDAMLLLLLLWLPITTMCFLLLSLVCFLPQMKIVWLLPRLSTILALSLGLPYLRNNLEEKLLCRLGYFKNSGSMEVSRTNSLTTPQLLNHLVITTCCVNFVLLAHAAPEFVSMHSIGDYIYFFFREEALSIESRERVSPFH